MNSESKNIALLLGGSSSEREISLLSGKNVGEALESRGHNVTYIDPSKSEDMETLKNGSFDIAYIALHGRGGEDGSIQAELEKIGIPYTGSKVESSINACNKLCAKKLYDFNRVPSAAYVGVTNDQDLDMDHIMNVLGDDVVVKAAKEGSSIGLYFAKGEEQIKDAIKKAGEYDKDILVEKRIPGREFTCAILEIDGEATALPVIEIVPKNEFYDFESKYDEGGSEHICPAKIDEDLAKRIQDIAMKAHKCLDCSGFSRTDIRVNDEGDAFALETNTIPGMTSKSLVPDAARAIGISFEDLCELIINNELR